LGVLNLLREISLPELRRHPLRHGLTIVGILLGVAVLAAVRSANASLSTQLRDTIEQVAGRAVLEVSGTAGVPEHVLDTVRDVAGVRAAVPVIEAVVGTPDPAQGNILLLGIDLVGDTWMRDYSIEQSGEGIADPLVFLAQPDSILVTREFAARHGLRENSRVELITGLGPKSFIIRGLMAPRGVARAFGGNLAVMDVFAAQFVLGRGKTFDRIDIALEDGVNLETTLAQFRSQVGSGFKVNPPRRRGRQIEALTQSYSRLLYVSGAIAMAVGVFLIFNAFAVSVAERRAQIGILRALGTTRRQVQAIFLGESLLVGLIGSAGGALLGIVLARAMVKVMAGVVSQTYGVHFSTDVKPDVVSLFFAIGLGLVASVAAAWIPARDAGRADPVLALQKGAYQIVGAGESRRRLRIGLLLLAVSVALGFSPWARAMRVQVVVFGAIFIALALLTPAFSHHVARLLRRPMSWIFGVEGRLASDSLVQAPRRTSATVAAVMFSLAFVLMMATFTVSVKTAMNKWIDSTLNPDLFVYASNSITALQNFQFPGSMAADLKSIPGIRQVDSVRVIQVPLERGMPQLMSIEIDQWLERARPLMDEGRVEELLPVMAGRNGLLISSNVARLHNLHKGSRIQLDTPTGRHEFDVVGVHVDYTSDAGQLVIDRATYKRLWRDDRVDTFDVMLHPNVDPEAVRREIQRRLASSHNAFVLTNGDVRREIMRLVDQFLSVQYAQILIAVVVAVLGILNSLLVSITERKKEIGILRSLGSERWQVRKAIMLEAVCISAVAIVLGIAAGSVLGYYAVTRFGAAFNGWIFPYYFPWAAALGIVPGVVAVALIGAWYPSTQAVKIQVVEALAYE
jgi:putative ABC transport system permease protein